MQSLIEKLQRWMLDANPGSRFTYYRGFLDTDALRSADGVDIEHAFRVAWDAYTSGWYDLVQRKYEMKDYEYIIIRRRTHQVVPARNAERLGYKPTLRIA
jgi:hypothetical protein